MYNEKRIEFDWKGFLLKLAFLIIVVILIVKLLPINNQNKTKELSTEFKENIITLKEKGAGYFTEDKLPTKVGEAAKVSLDDLIKVGVIKTLTDKSGKECNNKSSYIKAIKNSNDYELEVHLVCGKEKDTSRIYITNESKENKPTTTTTTKKIENEKETTKSNSNNTNKKPVEYITSKVIKTTKPVTNVSIIFNTNGGTAINSQFITIGSRATRPNNPTKAGYIFLGWFYEDKEYNFNASVSKNIILLAKWLPATNSNVIPSNNYTITFNSNGGTFVPSQTIKEGGYIVKPNNPFRSNVIFAGWYLNNKLFDFNTKIDKNITLVAKYYTNEIYVSDVNSISWNAPINSIISYNTLAIPQHLNGNNVEDVKVVSVNYLGALSTQSDYNNYQKSTFDYHSNNIDNTPSYSGNFAKINYANVYFSGRNITWIANVGSQCDYTFYYYNTNACLYGIKYRVTWQYKLFR